jgi:saccharopine dehydrogenase-like NADP-dependent oxidoreductase
MRNILILGAGKSSIALIDYLAEHAVSQNWQVTVGDITAALAMQKTKGRPRTKAITFDFSKADKRRALVAKADIVISMLPAALHITLAEDCLQAKKNLVTPSYISDAMKAMHSKVAKAGLVFMNEIGLDPGIDHMSALQMIDKLKAEGKVIKGFKSHCGGLVAPESDDNLWHYKFTWNPRNVILAGQGDGGIHYLSKGKTVNLKYEQLFAGAEELKVKGFGRFESYPNRDSLKYIAEYGLEGVKTMYRGTLRRPPYCKAWNALIQLGFTNPNYIDTETFKASVKKGLADKKIIKDRQIKALVHDTGVVALLDKQKDIKVMPALLLQQTLEGQWVMHPHDKDMVVMIHQVEYTNANGRNRQTLEASLVCLGKDVEHTAMAETVGLPVAIVTKMILNGDIKRRGVLMPKYPEIYNPILAELETYGVRFKEKVI